MTFCPGNGKGSISAIFDILLFLSALSYSCAKPVVDKGWRSTAYSKLVESSFVVDHQPWAFKTSL